MDPNAQNQTPIQPIQPPVVNQPIAQPTQPETLVMPEKNTKMLYLILALLVIVCIGALGTFLLIKRQPATPETKIAAPIVSPTSPSPTPTILPTKTPEQELQEVTIVDPTADITDINADLQQL